MIETPVAPATSPSPDVASSRTLPASTAPDAAPRPQIGWGTVLLGLGACALVLLLLENYIGIYMPDDAYITYRYAENLARGNGLVFNAAAQPVEGYSNLSWILLLAVLDRLGQDLTVWAARLGMVL